MVTVISESIVAVRDADARETALQQFAHRDRKSVAVLDVIQQILLTQRAVQRNQVLAAQNRSLARLVEVEARQVHFGAQLNRMVEQVGLGEA